MWSNLMCRLWQYADSPRKQCKLRTADCQLRLRNLPRGTLLMQVQVRTCQSSVVGIAKHVEKVREERHVPERPLE
jgi:hypothetical protein